MELALLPGFHLQLTDMDDGSLRLKIGPYDKGQLPEGITHTVSFVPREQRHLLAAFAEPPE